MATSFDSIYGSVENYSTDNSLDDLPDNLYYYSMWLSLKWAIAQFRKTSYFDLTDRTDFNQEIYQFTGTGAQTDFVLSPIPTDTIFYVTIDDVETTDYTYLAGTISFTVAPVLSSEIYVGTYTIGAFTDTLEDEEQEILAEGIALNLVKKNLFTTKQLNQMIYGNSIGLYSQANHNKTNNQIYQDFYNLWRVRITEYSYKNDPDDLTGLVGTPYV